MKQGLALILGKGPGDEEAPEPDDDEEDDDEEDTQSIAISAATDDVFTAFKRHDKSLFRKAMRDFIDIALAKRK